MKKVNIKDLKYNWKEKMIDGPCVLCGWRLGRCDIHHIILRSKGGSNESSNLIRICPNCHRLVHQKIINYDNKNEVFVRSDGLPILKTYK